MAEQKQNKLNAILEKMGFKDEKSRKYALIGLLAVIVFITLLVVDKIQKRSPAEQLPESGSMYIDLPEIEEGGDDQALRQSDGSLLDYYAGSDKRNRAGDFARRMWNDAGKGVDDQDIEDALNLVPDTTKKDGSPFGGSGSSIDEKIAEAFAQGQSSSASQQPSAPGYSSVPSGGGYSPQAQPSSRVMTDEEKMAERRKAIIAMGYNPDTGLPLSESPLAGTRQEEQAAGHESGGPSGPDLPESSISIKGRGDMSSFGGMSANDDGFSSFGTQKKAQEGTTKPYFKVAFAYSDRLKSGDRVSLRVKERLNIDGYDIPLNSIIFATCQISGSRLLLHVSNIDLNGKQYTLNYDAFDVDWEDGLYCPDASTKEAGRTAKDAASDLASSAVSGVVGSYAGRLVSTAASIFGSRSRQKDASVIVSEGYEFYLMPARKK